MTQSPDPMGSGVPDTAQPQPKQGRIRALGGNPRRKTLLLLAATAACVLGVNQMLQSNGGTPAEAAASKGAAAAMPTYYVSANGDDNADGTSPQTAWRTLDKVNKHRFLPGEKLLLHGGDRFTGDLSFGSPAAGRADLPVRVGSYGTGRATLVSSADKAAISIYNTAGLSVSDLVLVGSGAATSQVAGINVFTDTPTAQRLKGVWITDVDVSGFVDGIAVSSTANGTGFQDVEVAKSTLHGNRDSGLATSGPAITTTAPHYAVKDLRVSAVQAYANLGNPKDLVKNTGSGIIIGSADGALVQNSVAHSNGSRCKAPNGPVGIWAYNATDVVFRHNVSYANRTGGGADGGGFDLDENTSDSLIEDNLSYGNDGPGYLIYSAIKSGPSQHNTMRFNVSRDDSRKSAGYGQVNLSGYLIDIDVHHNTIAQTKPNSRTVLLRLGAHITSSTIRDNLLDSTGGPVVVAGQNYTTADVQLQGNDYWAPKANWGMVWDKSDFSSLTAWRTATKQELRDGQGTATIADPHLTWSRVASWDPTGSKGPVLPSTTNIDTAGLDLKSLFGTDPGTVDYFGSALASPTLIGATQP